MTERGRMLISLRAYAAYRGVAYSSAQNWEMRGWIRRTECGRIDVAQADADLEAHTVVGKSGRRFGLDDRRDLKALKGRERVHVDRPPLSHPRGCLGEVSAELDRPWPRAPVRRYKKQDRIRVVRETG